MRALVGDALPGPELRAGGRRARRRRSTTTRSRDASTTRYGALYEEFYGYRLDGDPDRARPARSRRDRRARAASPPARRCRRRRARRPGDEREVFFPGHGFVRRRIVRREALAPGAERRPGPLIVESMDSTVVVPPGWRARGRADGLRNLVRRDDALTWPSTRSRSPSSTTLREHLPRDGHHDDADRLLADLQRGARLLVRALRPARRHDRPGRVLPGAARRQPLHRPLDARGARRRRLRARRRRRSTTTRTAAARTSPSTA